MPTWIITALKKCVFLFVCLRVHRYIMSETAEPRADVDTQRLFVKALFFKQVTTPPREWLIPPSYPLCLIRTLMEEPRGMWQYSWFHTAARVASACSTFHASLRINLIGGYFIIMLATGDKTLCTRVKKKQTSCVNTAILGITESGCSYQTTENANDTKESQ